ncbi:MAG: 30S ribosomal protein S6 [Anaerolinea sp.]|nr:30S ribosomal protein S6 [Anaerolinea sp.]
MREYELTVVYDLAVQEAGGPEASVQQLTTLVESRGAKLLKVDHWGRRRMAYPINRAIDGDYIVTRIELEPGSVAPLEATLRIDERVYRHLIVRADELPIPVPPREPRQMAPAPVSEPGVEPAAESPAVPEAALAEAEAEVAPSAAVAETPAAAEEPAAEAIAAPAEAAAAVDSAPEAAGGQPAVPDSE